MCVIDIGGIVVNDCLKFLFIKDERMCHVETCMRSWSVFILMETMQRFMQHAAFCKYIIGHHPFFLVVIKTHAPTPYVFLLYFHCRLVLTNTKSNNII